MKCYCNYLLTEEYLEENPINKIIKRREAKQLPKNLSKEQIKELLGNLEFAYNKNTFNWYRNITIVYTYLYTWLRLSELTNLKFDDLKISEWFLIVKKLKMIQR